MRVTAALVLHVSVVGLAPNDVPIAVVLVAEQSNVPELLLRNSLNNGRRVPPLPVLLIHILNVTVDMAGIMPVTPGPPACVSKSLINFSPVPVPCRFGVWIAT